MTTTNKTVFISYAHQFGTLREEVAALAAWLRQQGVAVIFDGDYPNKPPPEGWPSWMGNGIEGADIVLVVCNENYNRLFARRAQPDDAGGRGVGWEGAIINQALYDSRVFNHKFFPVLPDGGAHSHVPRILRAFEHGHTFPGGNERILGLIKDDAKIAEIPALGLFHLPDLTLSNAFNNPESRDHTLRINLLAHMAEIGLNVTQAGKRLCIFWKHAVSRLIKQATMIAAVADSRVFRATCFLIVTCIGIFCWLCLAKFIRFEIIAAKGIMVVISLIDIAFVYAMLDFLCHAIRFRNIGKRIQNNLYYGGLDSGAGTLAVFLMFIGSFGRLPEAFFLWSIYHAASYICHSNL